MNREDARFIASALESRISGDRAELERLAASSLMQLSAIATAIDKQNREQWDPATWASDEIMAIARNGGAVVDSEMSERRVEGLRQFVEMMRKLADEPARPLNRAERRAAAAQQRVRETLERTIVKPLVILP